MKNALHLCAITLQYADILETSYNFVPEHTSIDSMPNFDARMYVLVHCYGVLHHLLQRRSISCKSRILNELIDIAEVFLCSSFWKNDKTPSKEQTVTTMQRRNTSSGGYLNDGRKSLQCCFKKT